jgi:hypothetical protein
MNEPLSTKQIEAILAQFKRVGVQERLQGSCGPVDLTAVRELVDRLTRAADPASGEKITQDDLVQAMDRMRNALRAQVKPR